MKSNEPVTEFWQIWLIAEEIGPSDWGLEISAQWPDQQEPKPSELSSASTVTRNRRILSPLFTPLAQAQPLPVLNDKQDEIGFFYHPKAYAALSALSQK